MPVPPFSEYFSAHAELQKLRLGGDQQSESYRLAQLALKHRVLNVLEKLARSKFGRGLTGSTESECLEIAERACDNLADRVCAGSCKVITTRFLMKYVLKDAYKIHRRRRRGEEQVKELFKNENSSRRLQGPAADGDSQGLGGDDFSLESDGLGRILASDDDLSSKLQSVELLLLRDLVVDILSLGKRSWIYFTLANNLPLPPGWQGQLSEVYLGARNRQATITRISKQLADIRRETTLALGKWAEKQLGNETGLRCFLDDLSEQVLEGFQTRDQESETAFKLTSEQKEEALALTIETNKSTIEKGLKLLVKYGEKDGFASADYPAIAGALTLLFNGLKDNDTDERINHAATAASTLIAADRVNADFEPLVPWLNRLGPSHDPEEEVESVVRGIQEIPMRVADLEPVDGETEAVKRRRFKTRETRIGRHEIAVNHVASIILQQDYREPEQSHFESLQRCDTRQELLVNLADATSPVELLKKRPELRQEAIDILDKWHEIPAGNACPMEEVFPHVLPTRADLMHCQELLNNWGTAAVAPPSSWGDVDAEHREPILAAFASGVVSRLEVICAAKSEVHD